VFAERGPDGVSIERVARVAGVGKSTIYRRWSSREDLIVDAIGELISDGPRPDTGSVRTDLIELLGHLRAAMTSAPAGQVFPRMLTEIAAGTPLGRAHISRIMGHYSAHLEAIFAAAIARRELARTFPVELAADILLGGLVFFRITHRLTGQQSRERIERLVDAALAGAAATTQPAHRSGASRSRRR
jgi:AcrR family transcriptional regulator